MSFDPDDEILQDFLVEAGEILEQLGEQLVDLEQSPTDSELLNAVFRGFHTIKGGASFVGLNNMVEVCHVAEDVFNQLRQGEREINAHLMDVILRVVDAVNDMFETVRGGVEAGPAAPELISQLKAIHDGTAVSEFDAAAAPASAPAPVAQEGAESTEPPSKLLAESGDDGDITDEEFEKLLDALDESETQVESATVDIEESAVSADDEITEEEFEQLLDDIHGDAQPGGQPTAEAATPVVSEDDITEEEFDMLLDNLHGKGQAPAAPAEASTAAGSGDEISEDEFENLLDDLHGKGSHGGVPLDTQAEQLVAQAAETTEQIAMAASTADTAPAPAPAVEAAPPAAPVTPAAESQPKPVAEAKTPAKPKTGKDAAPQGETTVRVDTKRLDDIMNMVGELVLVRNRLVTLESAMGNEEMAQAIGNLDLVTADLQTAVMKTRMQPIKKVFGRFPRVVRDLARSLRKEVSLDLFGEDTDLDKNLVEALADPLVHLVRNAVDHGIEMPDVRESVGKLKQGTVVLGAAQEGDHILLTIQDDGGGMDPDVLRAKAVEKGVMDAESARRLTDSEAFSLIFAPGFSTKDEISDISGRGVGMDVVKTRIVQLNGTIEIDSKLGVGTKLAIKVPLTLAIMPTLMVRLDEQIFALPLVSVNEIFNLDLTHTNTIDGQVCVMLRDSPLPIYFLRDWLVNQMNGVKKEAVGHVVVVTVGNQRVGFVVEHLIGQEEVVIKPLGAGLKGTQGLSGATITGDGRIALILDVPGLVKHYGRQMAHT